ncbi:YSIRK-type signal peptide-containing protein [Streptococcus pseudopneumoniae]|uniref:YSIRK-type signal peptide-containing protein n=1 Tax=Streptococcus pseudopneumoniae TaxID=257758 RepID=UPI0018B0D1A5|nr:YSIRK-type signal peptide-containing protein [Streptococcus pseudopneumoniae]MBF9684613.1 YSIRK-type signal peptide-containing protein [Streptococcus pseudopneumoniae]
MEDKSNSLSRVKRHQREKVLRFSIRKYSFGAASVAVAALMFMGANVVSADSPSQNTSSSTTGLASPKDGEQSSEAGQARDENQAEVASEPSANKEAQPAEEKAATVDSSRLSKLMEEVSALLSTDSKHDPSVVSPIKERLQKGKELLARADAGQGELDSLAEKLEKDLAVLSRSSKEESQPQGSESANKSSSSERSDHKEEGSDRAASASGAEDKPKRSRRSRRDLSARSAADNTDVEGALLRPKGYISEEKKVGGTDIGNRERTIQKTFMTARYSEENGQKFLTYDVYFQNDGRALEGSTRNAFWFYPPRELLYTSKGYPGGTLYDVSYERYRRNGDSGTLSHNPEKFIKVGDTYRVPSQVQDSSAGRIWGGGEYLYQLDGGPNRDNQREQMLKSLENDSELNAIIKRNNDSYPDLSYSHILNIPHGQDYAYKYHVKLRIKNNVSEDQARNSGSIAVTTKSGLASTAKAAYVYAAAGTRLVSRTDAETYPIQGSSHTKTVGDSLPSSDNPVGAGYITRKNGGEFPSGMSWSWEGGRTPSTARAGVFKYTSIATYKDGSKSTDAGSGSDGTVTLNVKPKKPTISGFENKKGLAGQTLTVNVGDGVPEGSKVNIYDGNRVIGTGTTNGKTATVTVTEALPGKPITAETIVNSGGEVKSERSDAVTPTEAPDTQAPTLTITPPNQKVTEGQEVTFTVRATDDQFVDIDFTDFGAKYLPRIQSQNITYKFDKRTENEKIVTFTIKTTKADIGNNTIRFKAKDRANNAAPDQTFSFEVTPATPTTETPVEIGITRKENGDAVVTPKKPGGGLYPKGTTVEIPGENGTKITVTIGDNGSGEVPNDKLPKGAVPGKGTVTEPDKKASQPVAVTTPARKTPTIDLVQDPTTGDVTVTPKKPDGSTYPKGTTVELPGKNGPITVTIGDDGSAKVPNNQLPDTTVSGKAKITEPGKEAVEVPKVETPAKVTPATPTTETPVEIGITRKENGDAVVTPKKPGGGLYPKGTTVEIPGENGTKITVTIGDNGSGEVPNDKLPKGAVPGKGTVTEPDKKASQPVAVTTPARKTPTIDLVQDPTTGDVTVTPKKPDGSTYPKGTTVELPGKNGPITVTIGDDGSAKVPNNQLPDTTVSGKAKITEPGKEAVEVPKVETPAKVTPATPTTETPGKIEITQQPNGNAIVTPKKPDGSTYPRGTKVEIPGENGTTITVTIGDNGSGEVPNDKLPKGAVPGKGRVTEPNKKPSQPVDVTTPARKTPTVELSQDPTTGDVTVTPKKPDGSTYPEGTIVELPGKDGRPIKVTIGADGSAKVPNDQLPDTTVSGKAKITEPGKAAVEVPNVTTPAKLTVSTEQPSKSHNVLPNTGTESNATLASLGLLGMLSGLGFAFRKKKED